MQKLNNILLKMFISPFSKDTPVDYKQTLKKARSILIGAAPGQGSSFNGLFCEEIAKIFPDKAIYMLYTEIPGTELSALPGHIALSFPVANPNLFQIVKSPVIKKLHAKRIDVFIDLDPEFNLLHAYICKKLNPSLRVSFKKKYSNIYSNLQFTLTSKQDLTGASARLIQFLKKL